MLSGELAPSAGNVRFAGHDVTRWSQPRRARAGLGRSYQRTTIFAEFSVLENCRLAAQASEPRPWLVWERAADDRRGIAIATRALAAAGLDGDAGRIASTLSHGAKRQLEIAMCLATAPRALLLDEPLAGMGAEETGRMLALLSGLKPTHAILLVEHDMDAVFRVADRITVMVNGQVIASDVPERIRSDPRGARSPTSATTTERPMTPAARRPRPARALRRQPRPARRDAAASAPAARSACSAGTAWARRR